MTMTHRALAAALVLAAATPAFAGDPQATRQDRTRAEIPPRALFICAADPDTRAAFQRQHGVEPVFMTAEQVLEARRDDITWRAPRCMTEREYARLSQSDTAFAEQRAPR
jgi:hypothetical protein